MDDSMLSMANSMANHCDYSIYDETIKYSEPISIIRMITSILSIFGSTSIIIAVFLTGKLNNAEVHPLFTLSVADFIISCTWVFGGAVWLYGKGTFNDSEAVEHGDGHGLGLCYMLSIATVILNITTYLLTVVYAAHALIKMKEIYNNKGRHVLESSKSWCSHFVTGLLYMLCWGLPAAIVLPVSESLVGIKVIGKACWCTVDFFNTRPDDGNSSVYNDIDKLATIIASYNGAFFLFSSISMIIIYSITLHLARKILEMQKSSQMDKRSGKVIRKLRARTFLFIAIFFICGLPAFLGSILVWNENRALTVLEVPDKIVLFLQALVGPLQGILNALFYGWSRKQFRKAIRIRVKVSLRPGKRIRGEDRDDAGLINVRQSRSYST